MEQQLVLMDMETSPPVRRLFLTMVDSMFHCLISNIAVAIGSNTNRHGTRRDHHGNQGWQLDHPGVSNPSHNIV